MAFDGNNGGRRRREVFGWIKKAAVLGFGVKTATIPNPAAVAAEEEMENGGRIVSFTVDNLSGEDGNSGTFKVQLMPDWAPKGTARFEVGW